MELRGEFEFENDKGEKIINAYSFNNFREDKSSQSNIINYFGRKTQKSSQYNSGLFMQLL